VKQSARNREPLPHAARERSDQVSTPGGEAGGGKRTIDEHGSIVEGVETSEKGQVFFGGQIVVDKRVVGEQADAAPNFFEVAVFRSEKPDTSRSWASEQGGNAEESGLAGTIRAKQCDKFAGIDGKGDLAERSHRPIAFFYVLKCDSEGWLRATHVFVAIGRRRLNL